MSYKINKILEPLNLNLILCPYLMKPALNIIIKIRETKKKCTIFYSSEKLIDEKFEQ